MVVDHHTGRLVWAAPGRDRRTVLAFFDQLGPERCRALELISADMAGWISGPICERAPQAERCVDPFHVVMLATDALDQVRREVWNEARRQGNPRLARELKGARFAVWKNPENLTDRQATKLAMIQQTNARLYRAYLLKEQLRQIYQLPTEQAERLLDRWLTWARPVPAPVVRQTRPHDHRATRRDPRRDPPRPLQRPDRADQHPDPPDHPPRIRVPHPAAPDRARDAQTRRPLSTTTAVTRPTETSGDSEKGGAGACSRPANTGRRLRSDRVGGTTTAFLESDRRDLPGADERYGDKGHPKVAPRPIAFVWDGRPLAEEPNSPRRANRGGARARSRRQQTRARLSGR